MDGEYPPAFHPFHNPGGPRVLLLLGTVEENVARRTMIASWRTTAENISIFFSSREQSADWHVKCSFGPLLLVLI